MNTDAVTVLRSLYGKPVNKTVHRMGDTLLKAMAKHDHCYIAQTRPVPDLATMAALLRELGANADCTLSLGLFKNAPAEPFLVLPVSLIAKLKAIDPNDRDKLAGCDLFPRIWVMRQESSPREEDFR